MTVFEKDLAILRKAKDEGKLTAQEKCVLKRAELLEARLRRT
jgi:hypothetical protein